MKTILKTSLIAVAFLLSMNAMAQFKIGARAGANVSSFGGDIEKPSSIIGYQAGVTVDYNFTEVFGIQTGADFIVKGSEMKQEFITGSGVWINMQKKPQYVQIPLHLSASLPLGETTRLSFHAGPYAAFGIGGKTSIKGEIDNSILQGKTKDEYTKNFFGDDNDQYKTFDYGIGGGVNFESGIISIGVGYDYGLADIDNREKDKTRVQSVYATFGLKF